MSRFVGRDKVDVVMSDEEYENDQPEEFSEDFEEEEQDTDDDIDQEIDNDEPETVIHDYDLAKVFLWAGLEEEADMRARIREFGTHGPSNVDDEENEEGEDERKGRLKLSEFIVSRIVKSNALPTTVKRETARDVTLDARDLFGQDVYKVSKLAFGETKAPGIFPPHLMSSVKRQRIFLVKKGERVTEMAKGKKDPAVVRNPTAKEARTVYVSSNGKDESTPKKFEAEIDKMFANLTSDEKKAYRAAAARYNRSQLRRTKKGKFVTRGLTIEGARIEQVKKKVILDARARFREDAIKYLRGEKPSDLFIRAPPVIERIEHEELFILPSEEGTITVGMEEAITFLRNVADDSVRDGYKNAYLKELEAQPEVRRVRRLAHEDILPRADQNLVEPRPLAYNEFNTLYQIGALVSFVNPSSATMHAFVLGTHTSYVKLFNPITGVVIRFRYDDIQESRLSNVPESYEVQMNVEGDRFEGELLKKAPMYLTYTESDEGGRFSPNIKVRRQLQEQRKGLVYQQGRGPAATHDTDKAHEIPKPKEVQITGRAAAQATNIARQKTGNLLDDILMGMNAVPPPAPAPVGVYVREEARKIGENETLLAEINASHIDGTERRSETVQETELEQASRNKKYRVVGREINGLRPGSFYQFTLKKREFSDTGNVADFNENGVIIISDTTAKAVFKAYDDENLRLIERRERIRIEPSLDYSSLMRAEPTERLKDMLARLLANAMGIPKHDIPLVTHVTLEEHMDKTFIDWWVPYTEAERLEMVDKDEQRERAARDVRERIKREIKNATTSEERRRLRAQRETDDAVELLTQVYIRQEADALLSDPRFDINRRKRDRVVFNSQKSEAALVSYVRYVHEMNSSRMLALMNDLNTEKNPYDMLPQDKSGPEDAYLRELRSRLRVQATPALHPQAAQDFKTWIDDTYNQAVKEGLTTLEYVTEMCKPLVLLVELHDQAVYFRSRLADGFYSPKEIPQMTLAHMFPELTSKYVLDGDEASYRFALQLLATVLERRVRQVLQDYFALADITVRRRDWVTGLPLSKDLLGEYLVKLNDAKVCGNTPSRKKMVNGVYQTQEGNIVFEPLPHDDVTICYDRDSKVFTCMSIRDAVLDIAAGRKNPMTGRPYPKDFMKRIRDRYPVESLKDKTAQQDIVRLPETRHYSRELRVREPTEITRFVIYRHDDDDEEDPFGYFRFQDMVEKGSITFKFITERNTDVTTVEIPVVRKRSGMKSGDTLVIAIAPGDPLPKIKRERPVYVVVFDHASRLSSKTRKDETRRVNGQYKQAYVLYRSMKTSVDVAEREALFDIYASNMSEGEKLILLE